MDIQVGDWVQIRGGAILLVRYVEKDLGMFVSHDGLTRDVSTVLEVRRTPVEQWEDVTSQCHLKWDGDGGKIVFDNEKRSLRIVWDVLHPCQQKNFKVSLNGGVLQVLMRKGAI